MLEVKKDQNGALIYGFSPADPYVRSVRQRLTASECRILSASLRDEQGLCPCAASRLSHLVSVYPLRPGIRTWKLIYGGNHGTRIWKEEAERLSAEYAADYEELKKQREESQELFRIQALIDSVLRNQQTQHQKKNDPTRS